VEALFLECDVQGRITWINEAARTRLGPSGNLLDGFPSQMQPEARLFLASKERTSLSGAYRPADRPGPIPARFWKVLSTSQRVLLGIEVRERASDRGAAEQNVSGFAGVEHRAVRNYFRLVRAHELLQKRRRRYAARGGPAVIEYLERERTRIGHELHAGAGQALAGIKLQLEILEAHLGSPSESVRHASERIHELAQDALAQLRAVTHRLYTPDWQRLRLEEALTRLWEITGIPQKFEARLELRLPPQEPPHAARVALYRTVQEALANIIRHSGARRVRLVLEQRGGRLELLLEDDGRGFDARQFLSGPPPSAGIGLRSMRDHVELLRGAFIVESGPEGTRLMVSLPVTPIHE
jgi:signal transduction histidine kinase